jgi:hypothetical protein
MFNEDNTFSGQNGIKKQSQTFLRRYIDDFEVLSNNGAPFYSGLSP